MRLEIVPAHVVSRCTGAVLVVLVSVGCGTPTHYYPELDAQTARTLEELVTEYESGAISRDHFRAAIAELEDPGMPRQLTHDIEVTTLLAARAEPYQVANDIEVLDGAILVIEEGAELILGADVSIFVKGRLYGIGSEQNTIRIRAAEGDHYGELRLENGPNQLVWMEFDRGNRNLKTTHPYDTTTLVESSRFDSWAYLAIAQLDSSGLRVRGSRFGYQTPESEIAGETIQAIGSGQIIIEDNEFSYRRGYRDVLDIHACRPDYWSIVAGNRFDGGEDDAIDLDGCNAIVVGNRIQNFRPEDL